MHRLRKSRALRSSNALAALLLGLAVCMAAAAQPAPDPPAAPSDSANVLVVDVQSDAARRRAWEDAMVTTLRRRQITATPSYRLFPLMAPPVSELTRIVLERHFDHVLATHFSTQADSRRPARFGADTGYRWLRHYDRYWHVIYGPDGADTTQPVECLTDIFTLHFAGSSAYWTEVTTPLTNQAEPQTAMAQISAAFMAALR